VDSFETSSFFALIAVDLKMACIDNVLCYNCYLKGNNDDTKR
jgi:hypothetical protein